MFSWIVPVLNKKVRESFLRSLTNIMLLFVKSLDKDNIVLSQSELKAFSEYVATLKTSYSKLSKGDQFVACAACSFFQAIDEAISEKQPRVAATLNLNVAYDSSGNATITVATKKSKNIFGEILENTDPSWKVDGKVLKDHVLESHRNMEEKPKVVS